MAIDASIPLGVRPAQGAQLADPLEQYGRMLSIKSLMGQQQLQGLQLDNAARDSQDRAALRSLFAGLQPGEGIESRLSQVFAIDPATGMSMQKNIGEQRKSDAELQKIRQEILLKETAAHRDALANVNDPQTAARWLQSGYANPVLASTLGRNGSLEEAVGRIPQDPQGFQQWKMQNALGATKFIELNKPSIHMQDTGGTSNVLSLPGLGGAPSTLSSTPKTNTPDALMSAGIAQRGQDLSASTTRRGQDMTDARARETLAQGRWANDLNNGVQVNTATGETRPITSGGVPVQKTPKLTEDQGKATGWLVQADNAYKNMVKAIDPAQGGKPSAANPGFNDALAAIPSMGLTTGVANILRGEKRQEFMQASSSLSEALLRAATGAGVNMSEAQQKIAELTPQIGDSDGVKKQKMDAIPLYLESLKVRAGPGAQQLPGIVERGTAAVAPTQADIDAELRKRGILK